MEKEVVYGNQKFTFLFGSFFWFNLSIFSEVASAPFILGFRDTCWFYRLYSLLASAKIQFSYFILKIITTRKRLKTYLHVP